MRLFAEEGPMGDPIEDIEQLLDDTARRCLRMMQSTPLTTAQFRALAKWMYGCGNQRHGLRERVERRGPQELTKVLTFIGRACEVMLTIMETVPPDDETESDRK